MTCGRPITSRSVESWTESYHSTNPALFPTEPTLFSCKLFRGEGEMLCSCPVHVSRYFNFFKPQVYLVDEQVLPPPPQPQPNPLSLYPPRFPTPFLYGSTISNPISLPFSLSPSLHFYLSLLASLPPPILSALPLTQQPSPCCGGMQSQVSPYSSK